MHTRSTWSTLTTVCIEWAEFIERGLRMVRHEFVDDLPPLGINPRWMATSVGWRCRTTSTVKTRDQLSNPTRADGKTLGQLTD